MRLEENATPFNPSTKRCVYFLLDESGGVLYVGQAQNIAVRIAAHQKEKSFASVSFIEVPKTDDPTELEAMFILKYCPPLNKRIDHPETVGYLAESTARAIVREVGRKWPTFIGEFRQNGGRIFHLNGKLYYGDELREVAAANAAKPV